MSIRIVRSGVAFDLHRFYWYAITAVAVAVDLVLDYPMTTTMI